MKFMKKMREVKHGGASFWYTDNDVCEDIDIDDDVEELEIDLDDERYTLTKMYITSA